ncbi:MAG: hypothetical protein KDA92_12350, partial [Planctomycetales bacterium]|nr:hypothetical protein [Planctomycetales bacterium]
MRRISRSGFRVVMSLILLWSCSTAVAQGNVESILFYDPLTGHLSIENVRPLTTLQLTSASGYFTGIRPAAFDSPFDVSSRTKLFRLDPNGFASLDFDIAVQPGLSFDTLANDLSAIGSLAGGGPISSIGLSTVDSVLPIQVGEVHVDPPPSSVYTAWTNLIYNPATGSLAIEDQAREKLESLVMRSTSGVFTGVRPETLAESDTYLPTQLAKTHAAGFEDVAFGPAVAPGLSFQALAADLSFQSSRLGPVSAQNFSLWTGDRYTPLSELTGGAPPDVADGYPIEPRFDSTGITRILYNSQTGDMAIEHTGLFPLGKTTLNSPGEIFWSGASGPFAVELATQLTTIAQPGSDRLELGRVARPGLTYQQLANDLSLGGTLGQRNALGEVGVWTGSEFLPLTGSQAAPPPEPSLTLLRYDPLTGDLSFELRHSGVLTQSITQLAIGSEEGLFVGDRPDLLGSDDRFDPKQLVVHSDAGISPAVVHGVLPKGLDAVDLAVDLCVSVKLSQTPWAVASRTAIEVDGRRVFPATCVSADGDPP